MQYYDWHNNLSTDPNWQMERGDEVTIIDLATGQTIDDVVRCDRRFSFQNLRAGDLWRVHAS